jgi:hypothetical protein
MLSFACPVCARLVAFENSHCLRCHTDIGYDPVGRTIEPVGVLHRCANVETAACNWLTAQPGQLCASCVLTRTRPADDDEAGLAGLRIAEAAKRRLLFELADLGLPVHGYEDTDGGLAFDLLSAETGSVTTGHAGGVITLNLNETDPARREQIRVAFGEPYRTVLGHLRHEIGHYYQTIVAAPGSDDEARCREVFGDEREDYAAAMDRYYRAGGAAPGWEQRFVSAYAAMHPWEDWAETFAHYLHIRDTLQTAAAYGLRSDGPSILTADSAPLHSDPDETPSDVRSMLDAWLPMTYALNAVSRSMGAGDLYPFVLTRQIEDKLALIDRLVRRAAALA